MTADSDQKILGYIQNDLLGGSVEVFSDTDLLKTGLIDSLGIMRLVAFLENEFKTTIPAQDLTLENFSSVNTIVAYLESRC